MKIKRKILSVILSLLILTQIFSNQKLITHAVSQFVVSTVTIGGVEYPCYENTDQNMPTGFQYFWATNGRVYHSDSANFLMLMLNKRFGLTVSSNWFTNFLSFCTTEMQGASTIIESLFTGSVYRVSNGVGVCGIALNDISGLPLADAMVNNQNTDVVVPDQVVDTTKNILDEYLEDNPITPDIINIPTRNKANFIANLSPNTNYQETLNLANNPPADILYNTGLLGVNDYLAFRINNSGFYTYTDATEYSLVSTSDSSFNQICTDYGLTIEENSISYNDFINSSSTQALQVNFKDISTGNNISLSSRKVSDNSVTATITSLPIISGLNKTIPFSDSKAFVTVYKSFNTITQITNNIYKQDIYVSNEWNNYNTSNDNSITTNSNTVNNSVNNNTSIYENTSTEVNNITKENNYYYDNSQIDNSVTTIINNYYGDNSGGGGDDDDDDDDTIWKALLKAIAGFFEKIGELIATLLTGIFSIFTSILDAITSITEDFSSITSFISSFFSWLPSEITSLIVLGLGLALICAFLTWFKK